MLSLIWAKKKKKCSHCNNFDSRTNLYAFGLSMCSRSALKPSTLFASCASLQKSLEFEDLGPKRIAALEKEAEEWRTKAEDAVASIQDITVTYFAQTSKALAGKKWCVYVSYLCAAELMNDFSVSFLSTQEMKCRSKLDWIHRHLIFYSFFNIQIIKISQRKWKC